MEPKIIYEDEFATIVFGLNPAALGHLKVFPKPKVAVIEDLPAKHVAHIFTLATRCASLLFDGLQAQGTNIILNEGKNANQTDDNICIDVIARAEGDGLKFNWEFKQGNYELVKQTASEISSKVIVYEKPAEIASATSQPPQQVKKESLPQITPDEKNEGKKIMPAEKKEDKTVAPPQTPQSLPSKKSNESLDKTITVVDESAPKKNAFYYELMRIP